MVGISWCDHSDGDVHGDDDGMEMETAWRWDGDGDDVGNFATNNHGDGNNCSWNDDQRDGILGFLSCRTPSIMVANISFSQAM